MSTKTSGGSTKRRWGWDAARGRTAWKDFSFFFGGGGFGGGWWFFIFFVGLKKVGGMGSCEVRKNGKRGLKIDKKNIYMEIDTIFQEINTI